MLMAIDVLHLILNNRYLQLITDRCY